MADILGQHGVRPASSLGGVAPDAIQFGSGNAALDKFLEGGLATGAVSEWGMPAGQSLREIALAVVGGATRREMMVLWVNGQDGLDVYPPAWSARGVDLRFIRFVTANKPLEVLKPVFLEPVFRLMVLDSPKHLGSEEWAFIARQARAMDIHVMVLHNFLLSGSRGNIWARLRINGKQRANGWRLEAMRGKAHKCLELTSDILFGLPSLDM